MTRSMLAQADLFGDDNEDCGPTLRATWASAMPAKRRRAAPLPDHEGAARLLDAHDDYRVLRRLKAPPVDLAYLPGPSAPMQTEGAPFQGLPQRRSFVPSEWIGALVKASRC